MDNFKLIGISGTNGAGKDAIGKFLAGQFGYVFISMTDTLRLELVRRKLPTTRENARTLSAEWRRQYGLGVLIDKAIETYKQTDHENKVGLAVSSLRNPGEVDRVHELGGRVIWVDADPRIRYDRLQANSLERGENRRTEDRVSFEEFVADEQVEMYPKSDDPAVLSMIDVKRKADILITNDGNDQQLLAAEISRALNN